MTTLSDIITPTNLVTLTGTQTLTNKTLTAPVIATIVNSGTLTLPTSTDTLVGRATTDTLTNKTLTAPTIASANLTTALTLAGAAGTNGQVLTSAGSGLPSWSTVSAGFTLGTPVNSTSGTAIDFTGIPTGIKQIVVSFNTVSTDGTSNMAIRIGDSGGIENTNYVSTSHSFVAGTISVTTDSACFVIKTASDTNQLSGSVILTLENSSTNTWAIQGIFAAMGANATFTLAGAKSLSAVLDRIRITTLNGSDAFDLGQINIAYI